MLEHNLHHVHTGGAHDPDVVEANMAFVRESSAPRWRKVLTALLVMCTWRLTYYAPSTFIQLRRKEQGLPPTVYKITSIFMFAGMFNFIASEGRRFWWRCILPYTVLRFVVYPALFLPLGSDACIRVLIALLIGEVCFNFYSWLVIASSHTAADLFRFDEKPTSKSVWLAHQVLGTCNYTRSPGIGDWTLGWINYHIEHHLAPNLTALQLERVSESTERACRQAGLPYILDSLFARSLHMFRIVTGSESMRRA